MARILIVEDSQFTRNTIVQIITDAGHKALEACSGREGLQKAIEYKPDCVLLDVLMPEMDGFGLLEALEKNNLVIPAIVLSADIQETSRTKCFELGAVDFVRKPHTKEKVLQAVDKALNLMLENQR